MGLEPMETKPGSSSVPTPGFNVKVLKGGDVEQTKGEKGAIAIQLPLPPGLFDYHMAGSSAVHRWLPARIRRLLQHWRQRLCR